MERRKGTAVSGGGEKDMLEWWGGGGGGEDMLAWQRAEKVLLEFMREIYASNL